MKINQSISRAIAALLLTAILMTSLSSCTLGYEILDLLFGDEINGDENNGNTPDDGEDKDDDSQNNQGGNIDNIPSGNIGEFYPGSGTADTSNIDPLKKSLLSTVSIISEFSNGSGAGSGVIYSVDKESGDAYIITSYHVIYNGTVAKTVKVYLYGMHLSSYAIKATLVGGSISEDIALLRVKGSEVIKNSYATAITMADSESVRAFDRVYAVGNCEGQGISATEGIVSVESEYLDANGSDGNTLSLRVMRIDAAVNRGNSGGGLFDSQGRLIGIVAAKDSSDGVDNMGYAIPSNLVNALVTNIINNCEGTTNKKVLKPIMGVTITSYVSGIQIDPDGSFYQVNLVEVSNVSKGSLAEGKVMVGDILKYIVIDGVRFDVHKSYHVTDNMFYASAGSVIQLGILRGETEMEIEVVIDDRSITTIK